MKTHHIFTTVGTSIITNSHKNLNHNLLATPYNQNTFNDKTWVSIKNAIQKTIDISTEHQYPSISAEICSTLSYINKLPKSTFEVQLYLICTDTLASLLSAELIKYFLSVKNIISDSRISIHRISNLSVHNSVNLEKLGITNLFTELNTIRKDIKGERELLVNITGGYKGIVPYMTTFAHLYNMNIIYQYEEDNTLQSGLVELNSIPLSIDTGRVEEIAFYLNPLFFNQTNHIAKNAETYRFLEKEGYVFKDNKGYHLTDSGVIIQSCADFKEEYSKDLLSFVVEYKCYEYFITKSGYINPVSNVHTTGKTVRSYHGYDNTEIDIAIYNKSVAVLGEVKTINLLKNKCAEVLQKFNRNILGFTKSKNKLNLDSTFLVLYGYFPISKSILNLLKQNLQSHHSPMRVPMDIYYIQVKNKPNDKHNVLQSFFQDPILDKDITYLFTHHK